MVKMVLKQMIVSVLCLYVFQQLVLADDDDEVDCVDVAMDELKTCKDWENVPVIYDTKITFDDNHHGIFNGQIIVNEAVTEGVEITLMVFLKTRNGDELVYSAGGDMCQSMNDKNALWAPVAEALNSSCPIHVGEYKLKDLRLDFQSMKPLMTRDYIGQYSITISVELAVKKYMCVLLMVEIFEETRLRSECPYPQKG